MKHHIRAVTTLPTTLCFYSGNTEDFMCKEIIFDNRKHTAKVITKEGCTFCYNCRKVIVKGVVQYD